jgi:branched-chain amino acid transport system ATP-binding protein
MSLLVVENLHSYYGDSHVLQGIGFSLDRGCVLSLLGRNGAGKTTTLRSILGIVPPRRGRIVLDGADVTGAAPYRVAQAGIGYVPETRGIFPSLTVLENLTLATRGDGWTLERAFDLFPRLAERRRVGGGRLSGGEQQMLSIARALLTNPKLLLLDEPTEGLAPIVVEEIERALSHLKSQSMSIVLVEQKIDLACALADEVVVLGKGQVRWSGKPESFAAADEVKATWLGL